MDPGEAPAFDADVRSTDSIARAGDWSLVLHSAAIAHRIEIRDGAIVIVVGPDDRAAALASLDAFDLESLPVVRAPAPDLGPSPLGLAFAVLLVALHVAAGARGDGAGAMWFHAGSASAEAIVQGEWWRTITALMLHADLLHLLGNVVGSLVFVSAVGRWLGVGLGGAVVLASAAVGNLLTAHFYQVRHVSVGASTATFAALGVLSGLQMVASPPASRAWPARVRVAAARRRPRTHRDDRQRRARRHRRASRRAGHGCRGGSARRRCRGRVGPRWDNGPCHWHDRHRQRNRPSAACREPCRPCLPR